MPWNIVAFVRFDSFLNLYISHGGALQFRKGLFDQRFCFNGRKGFAVMLQRPALWLIAENETDDESWFIKHGSFLLKSLISELSPHCLTFLICRPRRNARSDLTIGIFSTYPLVVRQADAFVYGMQLFIRRDVQGLNRTIVFFFRHAFTVCT